MAGVMVSVMMPAYNSQAYIQEALDSLLAQTYKDFEVIIVDDASTDNTYDIALEYAERDSRFKVYRNEENLGNGFTRKKALALSSGRYIAFLDSDDRWKAEKLEVFMNRLQECGGAAVCVHSNAAIIDEDGMITGEDFQSKINTQDNPVAGYLFHEMLLTNWINMPSALVSKETLINIGGFRGLYNMVDWDMWVRFAKEAEFVYIDQELTEYRIHGGGISSPNKKRIIARSREEVFANSLNLFEKVLPRKIISKIYYLRAANLLIIGEKKRGRVYFWKSWLNNHFSLRALFRAVLCR